MGTPNAGIPWLAELVAVGIGVAIVLAVWLAATR